MTSGDADLWSEQILEHLEWVRRLARGLVTDADAADDRRWRARGRAA
jgi:hypothetical protein